LSSLSDSEPLSPPCRGIIVFCPLSRLRLRVLLRLLIDFGLCAGLEVWGFPLPPELSACEHGDSGFLWKSGDGILGSIEGRKLALVLWVPCAAAFMWSIRRNIQILTLSYTETASASDAWLHNCCMRMDMHLLDCVSGKEPALAKGKLNNRKEYIAENPRITMQCSHHFHLGCIYEWMERSEACPVCGKVAFFSHLMLQ
ncbi:hypothetical protein Taro_034389, partial [Colocasia esculenta]|nr:hypothetical protein [Colocasia esculenta]